MSDIGLLTLAVGLIALALLYRELMTDYAPLTTQVDATLTTMAMAVQQLQVHVAALSRPNNDQATVDREIARLKVGTDQLAAAIATASQPTA